MDEQVSSDRPMTPRDAFAVPYMQLCQIGYSPNLDQYDTYLKQVDRPVSVPAQGDAATDAPLSGRWRLSWGPSISVDDAALAYVAGYHPGEPGNPGAFDPIPSQLCVIVRGTDLDVKDFWGRLLQVFWDLAVPNQLKPGWVPDPTVGTAQGTLDALDTVVSLKAGGETLRDHLLNFYADERRRVIPTFVTGHSLGGCVTTVLAPWLATDFADQNLKIRVVPVTFAAPTAGNRAFADYYDGLFRDAHRYVNPKDVVPDGFGDLRGIATIYEPCSIPLPDSMYIGLCGMSDALSLTGATYAQPRLGTTWLPDLCCTETSSLWDWYYEAGSQHAISRYIKLAGGKSIDDLGVDEMALVGLTNRPAGHLLSVLPHDLSRLRGPVDGPAPQG